MRLIVCSNSAPDAHFATGNKVGERFFASPGGLVPMMTSLLSETGGQWIFNATPLSAAQSPPRSATSADVTLRPVRFPAEISRPYAEDYCIKTLLWLFHYLCDTSLSEVPPLEKGLAWEAYRQVNQVFANTLLESCMGTSDEVILINDLHLLLVSGLFSEKLAGRESKLVYFHHVPWCEPEYFGILPRGQREEILKSLLSADVAGFHSVAWRNAFAACCTRYIPEADVTRDSISYGGHVTQLAVSPGTVSKENLQQTLDEHGTNARLEELGQRAAGRKVIARVDRMDLWKNHTRGFLAFERLLEDNPRLAPSLWFCAIASPTRIQTQRHRRYRAMCEETVDRINLRFGAGGEIVSLIYPDSSQHARQQAVAALSLASVTLVNPTWDGLNLVAKESILLGRRGKLILSTNAGAYDQLAAVSLTVNPFDEDATTVALGQAIDTSAASSAATAERARNLLAREDATTWLHTLLKGETAL